MRSIVKFSIVKKGLVYFPAQSRNSYVLELVNSETLISRNCE